MDAGHRRATIRRIGSRFANRLDPVRRRIGSRFAVDTRSLAALRIALGLALLVDLVHRAGSLEQFYTDRGTFPLSVFEAGYGHYGDLSLHAVSGEPWFQWFLFALAGLFALALVLGYRTRTVGFVSLVLLLSLHARNPTVLNGGDRLLRVLLLIALLAPLGERWSIDALRRGSARESIASVATAALLCQPVVVLTSNALLKHRGDTWYAGDALEIALRNDAMTVPLGAALAEYPALLTVLTYAWVTLLSGSSLFLLCTVGRARALAALAYVGAFAGMAATMAVGLFPLVLVAAVIPFLTAPFWDALARHVPVRWIGRRSAPDRPEASPAVDLPGPLGRPPLERRLLDSLRARGHEFAASYAVGYARSLLTVLGVVALAWMLLFAGSDVTGYDLPDAIDSPAVDQQQWGLYAPDPSESYSWYVVEADLADGSTVDALDGGPVSFDRPPDAAATYDTFRHRKFMGAVRNSGGEDPAGPVATRYADWACERAASTLDADPERVTIHRFHQPSPLDGEYEEPSHLTVVERDCAAS